MGIRIGIGGLKIGSSGSPSWTPQYFTETIDGVNFTLRKVVRMQGTDEVYAVDMTLTDLGFAGVEDTDFELIYGVIIN